MKPKSGHVTSCLTPPEVAEEKMMLRRGAVREHFVSGACLTIYLSNCLQILHTTPLGGLVVPFGVYEL